MVQCWREAFWSATTRPQPWSRPIVIESLSRRRATSASRYFRRSTAAASRRSCGGGVPPGGAPRRRVRARDQRHDLVADRLHYAPAGRLCGLAHALDAAPDRGERDRIARRLVELGAAAHVGKKDRRLLALFHPERDASGEAPSRQ